MNRAFTTKDKKTALKWIEEAEKVLTKQNKTLRHGNLQLEGITNIWEFSLRSRESLCVPHQVPQSLDITQKK